MRISDILKRGASPEPEKDNSGKIEEKNKIVIRQNTQESQVDPSGVSGEQLYNEAISVLEVFWKKLESGSELNNLAELKTLTLKLVKEFDRNPCFVGEVNKDYPQENYLPYHSVNVSLISIAIAKRLNETTEVMNDVALTALLHDVGMVKVPKNILFKKEKLLPSDMEKIRNHPVHNKEILERIKDVTGEILTAVLQSHERASGVGYPDGIKNGQIHSYARIVGLADTYEALTHDRVYRKAMSPYNVIKEIIRKNGQFFDHRVLKALIEAVTFYPVGCAVELSTGETGVVKNTNPDFPTRPYIEVVLDERKQRISDGKSIDLSKTPFISIRQILKKENPESFKK